MKRKEFKILLENWKKFLNESLREYSELHMYDFDDTLFRSPLPPKWWYKDYNVYLQWDQDNPAEKADGLTEDWDVSPQSLGPPFMDKNPVIESGLWKKEVLDSAKKSQAQDNVYNMFCTGREQVLYHHIKEMMDNVGLTFDSDKYFLQPDNRDTAMFKVNQISKVLDNNPSIKKVVIWEDSVTNLTKIEELCEARGLIFVGHKILKSPFKIEMTKEEYLDPHQP
ncbi:MAG: hypothetical protein HOK52_14630 [Candidatus Marinimicrobia bacterium]|jgi:hypothetical protein|nr:hypothetical protein [Candidatus Woesearchaeota archaeon]MBT6472483.1 hypothetical protein [Candidatus Neomarinimicrobiota bacterium]